MAKKATNADLVKALAKSEAANAKLAKKLETASAAPNAPAVKEEAPGASCDPSGRTVCSGGRVWDSVTESWKHKASIERRNKILAQ